jgi:hypothetical protein
MQNIASQIKKSGAYDYHAGSNVNIATNLKHFLCNVLQKIDSVRQALLHGHPVRTKRKKLTLNSDCGDFGSKKCKWGYDGASGGDWQSLTLIGVWSYAVDFQVGTFGRKVASVALNMFSNWIYFREKFYKFYV